jgi:hypothetical protein
MNAQDGLWKLRRRIWIHLLWMVPAAFGLKLYSGPGAWWVNDSLATVIYELFWIFFFFPFFCSRRAVVLVPATVLLVTSALEVLQLSRAGILQAIRSTFLGRSLIGTTFDAWDFPVYVVSCLLGWWWLRRLETQSVL